MPPFKQALTSIFRPVRNYFIKHPALLSGYIIYAYFLISTLDFYKDLKSSHFKSFDVVEKFDALLWMWLLAVALVKVIEYRQKAAEQERLRMEHEKELEVRGTQLTTAHMMIRTLQHQINNPLTVILLYVQRALRRESLTPQLQEAMEEIKNSSERIAGILREFAQAEGVETVESPVGDLIRPTTVHDSARTMDEASSPRS